MIAPPDTECQDCPIQAYAIHRIVIVTDHDVIIQDKCAACYEEVLREQG